jgi:uncharacterized protein
MWGRFPRPRIATYHVMPPDFPPHQFLLVAVLFEAALGVVAVAIGWFFGYAPAATAALDARAIGWGLFAAVPPLAVFWFCVRSTFRPLPDLVRVIDEQLAPLVRSCRWFDLAGMSVVAGVGEELLFRGLLQGGLALWIGPPWGVWVGLILAAAVFGLAHPITRTYALMAGAIGLYLGGLWIISGNLLVPITTHAMYDFIVLVYVVYLRGRSSNRAG